MSINSVIILSIIFYYIFIIILKNCACLKHNEPKNQEQNENNNINYNINNIPIQPVVRRRQRAGSH
jgi:hypothetical protein